MVSCHLQLSILIDGEQWKQSEYISTMCKQQNFTLFTTETGGKLFLSEEKHA